jgi:hypothetical protein
MLYIWKKKEARGANAVQVLTMHSSIKGTHTMCIELLRKLAHGAFY